MSHFLYFYYFLLDSFVWVLQKATDDFSNVDPSIVKGSTMVLSGEQAYSFVRSRAGVGSQLNTSRMDRQMKYMEGFVDSLQTVLAEDDMFFSHLWEDISDFVQTDCSLVVLNRLASDYGHYDFAGTIVIDGENVFGEKYYEFYPDETKLDSLILEYFYHEID